MRSGVWVAVAALLLSFISSADARTSEWRPFSVHDRQGAVEATLTYEAAPGLVGILVYRHVTLVVRRAGILAIRYEIRSGVLGNQPGGLLYETPAPRLRLVDVWGDSVPEAMVEYSSGGQGCCWITDIGILVGGHGHLLTHTFETLGVDSQRYQGQFQFVTQDERFVCIFSACPDSTFPIQVFAIDPTGRRFIDVTRTRGQAIEAQAGELIATPSPKREPFPSSDLQPMNSGLPSGQTRQKQRQRRGNGRQQNG